MFSYRDGWLLRGQKLNEANARIATLEAALRVAADSCERDRREPDKILCHAQTMRRATL